MVKPYIEATIKRGPHLSADSTRVMEVLHAETEEKVKNGYAKIHCYGDIKGKFKKLKISPVAMILHKYRAFRTILDL